MPSGSASTAETSSSASTWSPASITRSSRQSRAARPPSSTIASLAGARVHGTDSSRCRALGRPAEENRLATIACSAASTVSPQRPTSCEHLGRIAVGGQADGDQRRRRPRRS